LDAGLLDIEGDSDSDVSTDGLMIIRYLYGFRGNDLIGEILSPIPPDRDEDIRILGSGELVVRTSPMELFVDGLRVTIGDVSGDNLIQEIDIVMAIQHLESTNMGFPSPLSELEQILADVDGDGKISSLDARIIAAMTEDLIQDTDLPVSSGDVSGDAFLDTVDLILILEHFESIQMGGQTPLNASQLESADVDGDGQVTYEDMRIIAALVVGESLCHGLA